MSVGKTVVVLGASLNPDRYAYKAIVMLKEYGHRVIPVNPAIDTILDVPVVPSLDKIDEAVDTVTVYLGPARSEALVDGILALNPKRVILNPGAESELLSQKLKTAGIPVVEGCTLVMLRTGQF